LRRLNDDRFIQSAVMPSVWILVSSAIDIAAVVT